jgi:hypothetical protein
MWEADQAALRRKGPWHYTLPQITSHMDMTIHKPLGFEELSIELD